MDADGSNKINLTNTADINDRQPDWSPDGSKIAFASHRDDNRDIYVMDADGSNEIRLTTHTSLDEFPDWRPVAE
jgi:Tol biopolymer transport system component